MRHLLIILFLFITSLSFGQKWTFATSVGVNYPLDRKPLVDATKMDLREVFIQLSYQMYLSEDLHQIEPFVRIQRGYYQGIRAGLKAHLNAIPILTKEKYNIRTLIGLGLVYDSWDELIDFQIESKLSIRLHRAFIEAGAGLFVMEAQAYGSPPELFVSVGWVF